MRKALVYTALALVLYGAVLVSCQLLSPQSEVGLMIVWRDEMLSISFNQDPECPSADAGCSFIDFEAQPRDSLDKVKHMDSVFFELALLTA